MITRHHTKQLLITSVTTALAVSLTACSGADNTAESVTTMAGTDLSTRPQAATEDISPTPESLSDELPETKAMLAAAATGLKQLPGGTLVSLDRGTSGWELRVVMSDGTEHEMDIAAGGSTILRGPTVDQDDVDDLAEQRALVETKAIGYALAAKHALAELAKGELTELDLESDRGRTTWEAKVLDDQHIERSIRIDAVTGEVLSNHYDD